MTFPVKLKNLINVQRILRTMEVDGVGSTTEDITVKNAFAPLKLSGGGNGEEERDMKRTRTKTPNVAELDHQDRVRELEEKMKAVNFNVGTGEHSENVMNVIMQEIVDLNFRVGHLEHAVYDSWEFPLENAYVKEMETLKNEWLQRCRKLKGTGDSSLGGLKNFVFLGLINALLQGDKVPEAERHVVREVAVRLSGDGHGQIDAKKVKELHTLVAYAQTVIIQKTPKAFLNVKVRPENELLKKTVMEALDKNGKRQYDPPPLKPRTKDLRSKLQERTGK